MKMRVKKKDTFILPSFFFPLLLETKLSDMYIRDSACRAFAGLPLLFF